MTNNPLRSLYPNVNYMTIEDFEPMFVEWHQIHRDELETVRELEKFYRQVCSDIERSKNRREFKGWFFKRNPLLTLDLTPMLFPISDEEWDKSHSLYIRATYWFQIGKYFIAEDCFYKALQIGISTNNLSFVLSCLVSLCLTYLARSEFNEPLKIISAVSEIECLEKKENFDDKFFTIELIALAYKDKWDEVNKLKMKNKKIKPNKYINETIVDVWRFLSPYEPMSSQLNYWKSIWERVNGKE